MHHTFYELVDEVDRHSRRDRRMCVMGRGNQAGAEKHAQIGFPTIFKRRRKAEYFAGARINLNAGRVLRASGIQTFYCPCQRHAR